MARSRPLLLTGLAAAVTACGPFDGGSSSSNVTPAAETGGFGDRVWRDENCNGVQDPGEPGIEGVRIVIEEGTPEETDAFTDATGAFQVTGLVPGDYQVTIDETSLDSGFSPTLCDVGGDDGADNDCWPLSVTVESAVFDTSIDFGFTKPESLIGSLVWHDVNANGQQDGGEPGIEGVRVVLLDENGNETDERVTDAQGRYLFQALCAGKYAVDVDLSTVPPPFEPTIVDSAEVDDVFDSDPFGVEVLLITDRIRDYTIDFGFIAVGGSVGSIGDSVWFDSNGDGEKQASEPGLEGVGVTLFDDQGEVFRRTRSLADGVYRFTGLPLGVYTVEYDTATVPTLYAPTLCDSPSVHDAFDSDCNGVEVTLTDVKPDDRTVDFGFTSFCTGAIGNRVWLDENADGIQDAGEPGFPCVTVRLLDEQLTVLQEQTVAADGSYSFFGLCAGTYLVEVELSETLTGYEPSPCDDGSSGLFDSRCNPAVVELTSDHEKLVDVDFGYVPLGSGEIGDRVWRDLPLLGLQDSLAEDCFTGIYVQLLDSQGELICPTQAGANGCYLLEGLREGVYYVRVDESTVPPGYMPSPTGVGDPVFDSNTSPTKVTIGEGVGDTLSVDFGYYTDATNLATIGDLVWFDADGDGIQEPEPGFPNNGGIPFVGVMLFDSTDGLLVDQTRTDFKGEYTFTVEPGTYRVEVVESTLPASVVPTIADAGFDDALDSEVSPAIVSVAPSEVNLTVDFGFAPDCTTAVGDWIFFDANEDGLQDLGDVGIKGVVVRLLDGFGETAATAESDADGYYLFPAICPGTYTVVVDPDTLPAGFEPTLSDVGDDDAIDSESSPATVTVGTEPDLTIDFGFRTDVVTAIGDRIWIDEDGDGCQDPGDMGLEGVPVALFDRTTGVQTFLSASFEDGLYTLFAPMGGEYVVLYDPRVLPANLHPTDCEVCPDPALDSNCAPAFVSVVPGEDDATIDFGFAAEDTGKIGDLVWHDRNGDGLRQDGEGGLMGVRIRLFDAVTSGEVMSVTTGPLGEYLFTKVGAGDYRIVVDESTLPPFFAPTPCNVGMDDTVDNDCSPLGITLGEGECRFDVDFGFDSLCTGEIGDFVWLDANGNGSQDLGEPGLGGIEIVLKNEQGTVLSRAESDDTGFYVFAGLCAGIYRVEVDPATVPPGLLPTLCDAADDTLDSDCEPVLVTLPSNESVDHTIDFGFVASGGTIGDLLWIDEDEDGLQSFGGDDDDDGDDDDGDSPLPDVEVVLRDLKGTELDRVTSDSKGRYTFFGVLPGSYTVEVDPTTLPMGLVPTACDVGTDDSIDSDCAPATVFMPIQVIDVTSVDFGFVHAGMLEGEGCGPPYWTMYTTNWPGIYFDEMPFHVVFEDAFPGMTLYDVIRMGGSGLPRLGQQVVAALLNAEMLAVDYGLSVQQVVTLFNDLFPATPGEYDALGDFFETLNQRECPLY